ncbi:hypothetical protein GTY80_17930 [Amycolatopsis sp. SID8362]|nr:hypothetical protein [Amycolatopsis sp. SID8362]NED41816.1 hypothetical protein [Amycolatopsis sp. SID8362]
MVAAKLEQAQPWPVPGRPSPARPPGFEVEVTVRSDFPVSPALVVSLRPGLVLADEVLLEVLPGQPAFTGVASDMLAARMQETRLSYFHPEMFANEWTVNINNVLIFQSSDRQLPDLEAGAR